ncbi:hypothetical protein OH76DRAFT_699769 [Lentinus brumalis]|uniref:Uncharacterized protein n=1 Tax=Lentinus brumalis TaxID=2498619 RepID=A0A371D6J3_9APHY|nr:hypothetical protein OH76DRAFT_699769 [Polyporus brumalis]
MAEAERTFPSLSHTHIARSWCRLHRPSPALHRGLQRSNFRGIGSYTHRSEASCTPGPANWSDASKNDQPVSLGRATSPLEDHPEAMAGQCAHRRTNVRKHISSSSPGTQTEPGKCRTKVDFGMCHNDPRSMCTVIRIVNRTRVFNRNYTTAIEVKKPAEVRCAEKKLCCGVKVPRCAKTPFNLEAVPGLWVFPCVRVQCIVFGSTSSHFCRWGTLLPDRPRAKTPTWRRQLHWRELLLVDV